MKSTMELWRNVFLGVIFVPVFYKPMSCEDNQMSNDIWKGRRNFSREISDIFFQYKRKLR